MTTLAKISDEELARILYDALDELCPEMGWVSGFEPNRLVTYDGSFDILKLARIVRAKLDLDAQL